MGIFKYIFPLFIFIFLSFPKVFKSGRLTNILLAFKANKLIFPKLVYTGNYIYMGPNILLFIVNIKLIIITIFFYYLLTTTIL